MAKTIRLTESDLNRIIRKVIKEQRVQNLKSNDPNFLDQLLKLGKVVKSTDNAVEFKDRDDRVWVVSREIVMNLKGVDDQPQFIDDSKGNLTQEFIKLFDNRKSHYQQGGGYKNIYF